MAKATKKQALGRGLSALLKETPTDIISVSDKNADQLVGNILEIELKNIEVNPFQPRTYFDEEALTDRDIELSKRVYVDFPSNEQMIFDTGEDLKAKLKEIITKQAFR